MKKKYVKKYEKKGTKCTAGASASHMWRSQAERHDNQAAVSWRKKKEEEEEGGTAAPRDGQTKTGPLVTSASIHSITASHNKHAITVKRASKSPLGPRHPPRPAAKSDTTRNKRARNKPVGHPRWRHHPAPSAADVRAPCPSVRVWVDGYEKKKKEEEKKVSSGAESL